MSLKTSAPPASPSSRSGRPRPRNMRRPGHPGAAPRLLRGRQALSRSRDATLPLARLALSLKRPEVLAAATLCVCKSFADCRTVGLSPGWPQPLHSDEIPIDADLVRGLVDRAMPAHAGSPVRRLAASGSTNALYRLGDELLVRLPRQPGGSATISKEATWLPVLAPLLPVSVPDVVAVFEPDRDYPERWSVVRWIEGTHPEVVDPALRRRAARTPGDEPGHGSGRPAAGRGTHPGRPRPTPAVVPR